MRSQRTRDDGSSHLDQRPEPGPSHRGVIDEQGPEASDDVRLERRPFAQGLWCGRIRSQRLQALQARFEREEIGRAGGTRHRQYQHGPHQQRACHRNHATGGEVSASTRTRHRSRARSTRAQPRDDLSDILEPGPSQIREERPRVQRQPRRRRPPSERVWRHPQPMAGHVAQEPMHGIHLRRAAAIRRLPCRIDRVRLPVEEPGTAAPDPYTIDVEERLGPVVASRGDLGCQIEQPSSNVRPCRRSSAAAQRRTLHRLVGIPTRLGVARAGQPAQSAGPADSPAAPATREASLPGRNGSTLGARDARRSRPGRHAGADVSSNTT